jgi:glycosyltransferase involved in cell wall biosynthesis
LRILYHHRTRGAGVERVHILGIAEALRGLGHQVDVMSVSGLEHAESGVAPVTAKGWKWRLIHAITTRIPEFLFEFLELAYNVVAAWRITKYVNQCRPELIYERYSMFLWAGVWVAKRHGISIILEVNDSAAVERVRPLFFVALARRIERWIFRNCSGIVFVSGQFQREVVEHFGELAPSIVSPNGADISQFSPSAELRERTRRELKVENKVVCGYVGAFVHWHGIDWFVRDIIDEMKRQPELVLLLVGDGRLYDEIQRLVADRGAAQRILLTGRVPHAQVSSLIAAMDFAVLPDSNTYGSPMKLFELMAMGIGVVAPSFSPVCEVVDDQKTGWLFPARDHQACVERVLMIAGQREEQSHVGTAARHYIAEHRQWKNNVNQLLALYRQVKDGKGGVV